MRFLSFKINIAALVNPVVIGCAGRLVISFNNLGGLARFVINFYNLHRNRLFVDGRPVNVKVIPVCGIEIIFQGHAPAPIFNLL